MKIVFTNGCFDVLHRGHLEYLKKSKELGCYLIIGLNSDESVKRLKGSSRPINNQNDRKFFLEQLSFVDEVILFDEDTPERLISTIKPDIVTKASDYTKEQVSRVSGDAEVIIIDKVDGYSTTNLLEKLCK